MRQPKKTNKRQLTTKRGKISPLASVLGATFLASAMMPMASAAATRPFVADELRTASGAPLASYHVERGRGGDSHEGGCGDGSCGGEGKGSGEGGHSAAGEGDGSCGEGSCGEGGASAAGDATKSATDHAAGSGAADEGGCGEGRCG